jgi:glutaredoxin 3
MSKVTFYHAGCPVCVGAEQEIVKLLGSENLSIIHLGEQKEKIREALDHGVKSVPAVVTPSGAVLHINFGASMDDLLN